MVDAPAHAVDVRGRKAGLGSAMQDEQAFLARAALVDPLPRPIRRGIIHDEDVRGRDVCPDLLQDRRQRRHLVVGGDHDQGVVALRRGSKTLRGSHESHSASFNEWSHVLHAPRRASGSP